METEAETAIPNLKLELESQRLARGLEESAGSVSRSSSTTSPQGAFDVSKNTVLVPTFRETKVDSGLFWCALLRPYSGHLKFGLSGFSVDSKGKLQFLLTTFAI